MNYIKHLTGFFEKASTDEELNPTHISLYIAIFQLWNKNGFQKSIPISRDELMRISKIGSNATYHKCIKELHERNYVKYMPSHNQFKGSRVEVVSLESYKNCSHKAARPRKARSGFELGREPDADQALNKTCTSAELIPYINTLNHLNVENDGAQQKEEVTDSLFIPNGAEAPKKLPPKNGSSIRISLAPQWETVQLFFVGNQFPAVEAQKFFNHFESNGWLVGGKSPMKDWQAAARNWMLKAADFQTKNSSPKPEHLHTPNTKNYDEPL